jgi:hypothetical protein
MIAEQSNFIVIHLCRVLGFTNGQWELYNHGTKRAERLAKFRRFAHCANLKGDA